jgi:hypothetical protein
MQQFWTKLRKSDRRDGGANRSSGRGAFASTERHHFSDPRHFHCLIASESFVTPSTQDFSKSMTSGWSCRFFQHQLHSASTQIAPNANCSFHNDRAPPYFSRTLPPSRRDDRGWSLIHEYAWRGYRGTHQVSPPICEFSDALIAAANERDQQASRAEQAEARFAAIEAGLSRNAARRETHIVVPIATLRLAEAQFKSLARAFEKSGNIVSQVMCEASASALDRAALEADAPLSADRPKHAAA